MTVTKPDAARFRFVELDALRGVAAMNVVLFHFAMFAVVEQRAHGPIMALARPIIAGHAAVILFFMLSGFVLSISTWRGTTLPYRHFLVRRIFRIYIPYVASLVIAIIGSAIYWRWGSSYSLGHGAWVTPPTVRSVIQHVIFLGHYDFRYNPAYWSLVIEMRLSIVFPLVCLVLKRTATPLAALAAIFFSATAIAIDILSVHADTDLVRTTWPATLHYLAFFIIGALMARRLSREPWPAIPRVATILMLPVSVALWAYAPSLGRLIPPLPAGAPEMLIDWPEALGAMGLIYLAATHPRVKRTLAHFTLRFLGHISYSLYLLHFVVLMALVALLHNHVPMAALFPVYLLSTIALAALFNRTVEMPAMNIGRKLTSSRVKRVPAPPVEAGVAYTATTSQDV